MLDKVLTTWTLPYLSSTPSPHPTPQKNPKLWPFLTFTQRSFRRLISGAFLIRTLERSSSVSTGLWCWALRELYSARNSKCCLGVQKWGMRSWRGKKYLGTGEHTHTGMMGDYGQCKMVSAMLCYHVSRRGTQMNSLLNVWVTHIMTKTR